MQTENVLIARVCHDLITPCNAINLGLEAYEISEDKSLLPSVKDSAVKMNILLKFMRELFIKKDDSYSYSVDFLNKLVSEFLGVYNIGCSFVTNCDNCDCQLGRIILCNASIMKELMPAGGKVEFNVNSDCVSVVYSGSNVKELDTVIPEELTYRNVLRFKLLERLQICRFSVTSLVDKDTGKIVEIRN